MGPWENYKDEDQGPWSQYDSPEVEEAPREKPDAWTSFKEGSLIAPLRSIERTVVPFGGAIHHAVIDPIMGLYEGRSANERLAEREAYDQYLRETYPSQRAMDIGGFVGGMGTIPTDTKYLDKLRIAASEGSKYAKQLLGRVKLGAASIAGSPVSQAMTPITDQAVTHPESVGANLETGINLAPPAIQGAMELPIMAGRQLAKLKTRPADRGSIPKYEADPARYDAYEEATDLKPRESLVREMKGNLEAVEQKRAADYELKKREVADLSDAVKSEQKRAIMDVEDQTKLGTLDGDRVVKVVGDLQEQYAKTSEQRNKILEETRGEMDLRVIQPLFRRAYNSVFSAPDREAIQNAWRNLASMAKPGATTRYAISPRELDQFRRLLQDQVDYRFGAHNQPYQRKLNSLAHEINDILDLSIPENNAMRSQIRQETVRFKKAMELFGGEYPLGKIESSLKDPMKKRDIINLNVPEMDDLIKTIEYREKFKRDLKLGIRPDTPSTKPYQDQRAALESMEKGSLPLSSRNVESTLNSAMVSNPMHPRVNQQDALHWYGENVHAKGADDFYDQFDKNKVLRDLSAMDTINGSRMTNLGKSWLGPLGAYFGAAADQATSQAFRSTARLNASPGYNTFKRSIGTAQLAKEYGNPARQNTDIPFDKLAGTPYEVMFIQAMQEGNNKPAMLHYMLSKRDPEYQALTMSDEKKKPLATPKYKGLGADLGGIIDNFTGSDNIGLDPQEKPAEGFEYGEGVPQPASIKPFSFKKLFPKFSGEGSQIKQLPKMERYGTGMRGLGFFQGYRDLNVGGDVQRFWGGKLHPSEKFAGKKFDEAYSSQHPERDSYMYHSDGAVIPGKDGGTQFGFSRGVDAVPHEHIHAQLNNLRKIHPDAEKAMDWHLRNKLKSYGANPERIDMHTRDPVEFMTSIRDALDEKATRASLKMETDQKFAKRWPQYVQGNREYLQKLRKFYNDAAYEAENMTKDDLLNIIDRYKKETIKDTLMKRNDPNYSKYRDTHKAPNKERSSPVWDLKDTYPDDIYTPKAKQYYGDGSDFDQESIDKIWKAKGNPDAEIEVFRAVPVDVNDGINAGDWVSPSLQYAKLHGERRFDGKYRIIKIKAKAKDLFTDGNSIHEWGYDPSN